MHVLRETLLVVAIVLVPSPCGKSSVEQNAEPVESFERIEYARETSHFGERLSGVTDWGTASTAVAKSKRVEKILGSKLESLMIVIRGLKIRDGGLTSQKT